MKIELAKNEIIHFVGIGGIGMSGLSLIMKGKGFKVQGSDVSNNSGVRPAIVVSEVRSTARKRRQAASTTAASAVMPDSRSCL